MTFQDLVRLTLRHIVTIISAVVLALAAAYALYVIAPRVYQADATAYVSISAEEPAPDEVLNESRQTYSNLVLAQQKAKTFVSVINSRAVAEKASEILGGRLSAGQIAANTRVDLPDNSVAIRVTMSADSPEQARDAADAMVEATARQVREMEGTGSPVSITPLSSALLPSRPSSPNLPLYITAGLLAGLVIGYGIALLRRTYDTRIRTSEDLTRAGHQGLLGVVPRMRDKEESIALENSSDFVMREAFRKLRTNLQYVDIDNPPRSVVVTSALMSEGKSTVSINLALVLARAGKRVVLIDTDLRRPSVHTKLKVDGKIGLTQVLTGKVSLEDAILDHQVKNLAILPAGEIPPNPSEILGSRRMAELIEHLQEDAFVICDAPPLLPVTDAALLSRATDGAILVVSAGHTRVEQLQGAEQNLEKLRAKVFGYVLNGVSRSRVDAIRYGQGEYGYSQAYEHKSEEKSEPEAKSPDEAPLPAFKTDSAPSELDSQPAAPSETGGTWQEPPLPPESRRASREGARRVPVSFSEVISPSSEAPVATTERSREDSPRWRALQEAQEAAK